MILLVVKRNARYNLIVLFAILLFLIFDSAIALQQDSTNKIDLKKKNPFTPYQYDKDDSLKTKTTVVEQIDKPGKRYELEHSAFQDSAYYKAMRIRIPASVRLNNDMQNLAMAWAREQSIAQEQPWESAQRNMQIPSEFLKPSQVEMVLRQEMIQRAQYVPYVNTLPRGGFTVGLNTIGVFLGVTEDVSPDIKFSIDRTDDVEITVFSIQAVAVATVFKGELKSGSYNYIWNFRDDKGRSMPSGDYIAEVRVGRTKFFRKRITIP